MVQTARVKRILALAPRPCRSGAYHVDGRTIKAFWLGTFITHAGGLSGDCVGLGMGINFFEKNDQRGEDGDRFGYVGCPLSVTPTVDHAKAVFVFAWRQITRMALPGLCKILNRSSLPLRPWRGVPLRVHVD
jgi:hypothetical protein